MGSVLLVLQLVVAIFLVAVILLQRSNGSALSGLGGATSAGGLLSARGKGNILTRITAILAFLFFSLSLALSIHYSHLEVKSSSIVDAKTATTAPVSQNSTENENNAPAENQIPANDNAPATEPTPVAEPEVPVAE